MSLPGNGIYVVRGEMSTLVTAMRRGLGWNASSEETDALLKPFINLKQVLNRIDDLRIIDPRIFLEPFLDVIQTHKTTSAVTSLALASVNKFLSYGLIDPTTPYLAGIVELIVKAVTEARFMSTDQSSNGVTFLRAIEVLRTLMRSPEGSKLSHGSVIQLMHRLFRIHKSGPNELLRRSAEQALRDMILLFFMRLPQFSAEHTELTRQRLLQKPTCKPAAEQSAKSSPINGTSTLKVPPLETTPATPAGSILGLDGDVQVTQTPNTTIQPTPTPTLQVNSATVEQAAESEPTKSTEESSDSNEYINSLGVRFTQQDSEELAEGAAFKAAPYGLPFIEYLFGYLTTLCNPHDKTNNDTDIHIGLSLLTVAFEVAADNIGKYQTLLKLVKDELCKNLIALLSSERITILAADLRLCFLLFVSLRGHLKLQLEVYLKQLAEIIANDNPKPQYEARELALENLLQLWRIPGFVTELYVNYDCDLYCSDIFENLTKLLSQHVNSATNGVYSTHVLAMEALISVIDNIEANCNTTKNESANETQGRHSRHGSSGLAGINLDDENEQFVIENFNKFVNISADKKTQACKITREHLAKLKQTKCTLTKGTADFNDKSPDAGIRYLQEHGYLNTQLDTNEVAHFLRQNPGLSKAVIGEYISKKKDDNLQILRSFVESFEFTGLRIDTALRVFLETFRLPGEAPLIANILEHFAEHWMQQNGEPFANRDAAYVLAYAVIMLNTDHHNSNAQRVQVPMTLEQFQKNLRGVNGGADFEQSMLTQIYEAISTEEIVLPAEQTGLVKENYVWKILLRRSMGGDGEFNFVHDSAYDVEIFNMVWAALLPALSLMFDRNTELGCQRTLAGFAKCAAISAHYNLHKEFDALLLTLCAFTSLLNALPDDQQSLPIAYNDCQLAANFGRNLKAQAAMRTLFILVHNYADCLRESWSTVLDLILQLFRLKLLPKSFMEVEDFCEDKGKAQLIVEKPRERHQESGLFSSIVSYLAPEGQREPTQEEQEYIKLAKKCIKDCQLEQLLQESKFVQECSLQELIQCLLAFIKPPAMHKSINTPYAEDVVVFWLEFLVKIVVYNRDRMIPLWPDVRDQLYLLLIGSASCGYEYLLHRCIVGILKIAIDLMRNEKLCPVLLHSLKMLLKLKPVVINRIAIQISIGLYELLKTSAQNIHSEQDWQIIFTLLECVGGGALPPPLDDVTLPIPSAGSPSSDGATSSEEDIVKLSRGLGAELIEQQHQATTNGSGGPSSPVADNWTFLSKDATEQSPAISRPQSPQNNNISEPAALIFNCRLLSHKPYALHKCWESLAFIVRNVAHITPYNFESCVHCIRTFVEVCSDGGYRQRRRLVESTERRPSGKRQERESGPAATPATASHESNEEAEIALIYEKLSKDLLDLMYTLHMRTGQIFRWWAEELAAVPQCSALWAQGFCPLLQGIARTAMDRRRNVRTHAIACLQRALLVQELQNLTGAEWSLCFRHILFPLSNELLPECASIQHLDALLLEESRIRIAGIMSKVFLQHLTPLIELNEAFNALWLELLDFIDRFMKVGSDMLSEQMLEILKNMLLVMHSVQVFETTGNNGRLWAITWQRIDEFLPNLRQEIFRDDDKRQAENLVGAAVVPTETITDVPAVEIISGGHKLPAVEAMNSTHVLVTAEEPNVEIITPDSLQPALLNVHEYKATPLCVPQTPASESNATPTIEAITIIEPPVLNAVSAPASTPVSEAYTFSIELPAQTATANDQDTTPALPVACSSDALVRQQYTQLYQTPLAVPIATHVTSLSDCQQTPTSSSVPRIPNHTLAQSFAATPAFIVRSDSGAHAGVDIYQEYVQNPYNLTMQQTLSTPTTTATTASIAFGGNTPANYFSTSIDPNEIPPGSELLYGQH